MDPIIFLFTILFLLVVISIVGCLLIFRAKKEAKRQIEKLEERLNEDVQSRTRNNPIPLGDDAPISGQELKIMTDNDPTLDWLLKNRASKGYKD